MTYRKAARTYSKSAKVRLEAMERAVKVIEIGGATSSSIVIPCVPPPHPILSLYAQSTSFVPPDLVGVTQLELQQVIATVTFGPSGVLHPALVGLEEPARAPDLVLVAPLALVGLEEPGGRRDPATDIVVETITGGGRAAAPDLILVTPLALGVASWG
jgi:hypothetical protein